MENSCMHCALIAVTVLFCTIVHVGGAAQTHHAAVALRFNRPFFTGAGGIAKRIIDGLEQELRIKPKKFKLPFISFQTGWINVTHIEIPRTEFSISNGGLAWNSEGGEVGLSLDYVFHVGPFTETGLANISFSNLRTNVSTHVTTSHLRPHFEIAWCKLELSKENIKIDGSTTGILLSLFKGLIVNWSRGFLQHTICLFFTTSSDLANEFIEFQPEEIRAFNNIYLNYSAVSEPIFNDDFLEATCTFRADMIGNYSDSSYSDNMGSLERSTTEKIAFSMRESDSWRALKFETTNSAINSFLFTLSDLILEAVYWICVIYFVGECVLYVWKRQGIATEKQNTEEKIPLLAIQRGVR